MSAHMIWLIAMAIATITILTVSTLAAAGILTRERPQSERADQPAGRR